jgi:alpha-beta hydrolase superfamily lysophospholipase
MGTSTGGSLAVWAAAQPRWRNTLAALVLLSPNFGLRHPAARLLTWPGGGLVVRVLVGKERRFEPQNERQGRHWTACYPSSALLQLMALVRDVRALPLRTVTMPVFVAYSERDKVVDPAATRRALTRFGSTEVRLYAVEGDGDANHHVVAGDILSPATTGPLAREILSFMERVA